MQCRTDTAVTFYCSGGSPRQPWSSGLVPVSRFHSSVLLFRSSLSLIGLLASVDIKQQKLAGVVTPVVVLQVALLIQSDKLKNDYTYLSWLARVCKSLSGGVFGVLVESSFFFFFLWRSALCLDLLLTGKLKGCLSKMLPIDINDIVRYGVLHHLC